MMVLTRDFLIRAVPSILTFCCLFLLTNPLFAQAPLFTDVALDNIQLSESQEKVLELLQRSETTINLRIVKVNIESLRQGSSNRIDLFAGKSFVALKERIQTRSVTDFDWYGSIPGKSNNIILSAYEDAVVGSMTIENESYNLRSLGDGLHAIVHVDPSKYAPCGNTPMQTIQNDSKASNGERGALSSQGPKILSEQGSVESEHGGMNLLSSTEIIRVLVAYTPAAKSEAASSVGIDALVTNAIAQANLSYNSSSISIQLQLAHKVAVSYTETGIDVDAFPDDCTPPNVQRIRLRVLDRFQNPSDGYMDEVHVLRDAFGADVAVLLTGAIIGDCGQAFEIGLGAPDAFSVVKWSCAAAGGNWSLAHEIGHLQGVRHEDDSCTFPFAYGHGFTTEDKQWKTIMGTNLAATRIRKWSGPNVDHQGYQMGNTTTNDAVRALTETVLSVANFETDPQPGDGDVNQDGVVDVQDLIRVINIILAIGPAPTVAELVAANMNADEVIDVADLIIMINIILQSGGDPGEIAEALELLS